MDPKGNGHLSGQLGIINEWLQAILEVIFCEKTPSPSKIVYEDRKVFNAIRILE